MSSKKRMLAKSLLLLTKIFCLSLMTIVMSRQMMVNSIRIVRYFDPAHPEPNMKYIETLIGSNLTLFCQVILEANDQLYSLKWYRQYNGTYYEFYSYIASPNQTIHHKTLPGIQLDLDGDKPNGEIIHLINVNLDTKGIYKCEATSDETFQVDRIEFNLTVLVPPIESPRMISSRKIYSLGDRVQLKCISGLSRPAPQIKWYINNVAVPESNKKNWTVDVYDYQTINHVVEDNEANKPKQDRLPFYDDDNNNKNTREQSLLNHEKLRKISLLNFILKYEYLTNKESNHFSVRCASLIETKFYPQHQQSKSKMDSKKSWPSNYPEAVTPIIVGLQDEYRIGDLINVRCLLPPRVYDRTINIKIEWTINHKKIDPSKVIINKNGESKLCIKLANHHFDELGSFSLKCKAIQKWPTRKIRNHVQYHSNEDKNEKSNISNEWNNTSLFQDTNINLVQGRPELFKLVGAAFIPIAVIMVVLMIG